MTIVSKKNIITKYYRDKLISDVWVKDRKESSIKKRTDGTDIYYSNSAKKELLISVIENAQKTICFASPKLDDVTIIEILVLARERGVRVYILLEKMNNKVLLPLIGKSFIKTGISFDGSFCITDPSDDITACFINDELCQDWFEMDNISVSLDIEQAAQMYRLFCRWFWNEAKKEIRNDKGEKDAVISPYGQIPMTERTFISPLCKQMLQKKINSKSISLVRNIDGENRLISDIKFQGKILVNAKGNKPEILNSQNSSTEILGTFSQEISPIQVICISSKEVYLIPSATETKSKEQAYLLLLNERQSKEMMTYLKEIEQSYHLVYHSEISYHDCSEKNLYRIGQWDKPFQVKSKIVLENQKSLVSLGELEEPSFENYLEEKKILACEVDYPIILEPVKLPKNASQHRLYQDWSKAINDFVVKKEELLKGLNYIKDQNKSLNIFTFMGSFTTGKNTMIKDLEKRINELKEPASKSIVIVEKCYESINNLIPEINQQVEDLGKESKKAKARKAFEDEKEHNKKELENLKKRIAPSEKELSEKEARQGEIKGKEAKLRKELEDDFLVEFFSISYNVEGERVRGKTDWESSYQKWNWNLEQLTFSQIKAKVTETWTSIKKEKVKYSDEEREHIQELNDRLNNLYQSIKNEKRDLDKAINDLKKIIKQDAKKIEELEILLKKEFRYEDGVSRQKGSMGKMRSKGKHSSRNKNSLSKQISTLKPQTIPKKELPEVGKLYHLGNTDYLTIQNWNEYKEAKIEAARLSVQIQNICVPT